MFGLSLYQVREEVRKIQSNDLDRLKSDFTNNWRNRSIHTNTNPSPTFLPVIPPPKILELGQKIILQTLPCQVLAFKFLSVLSPDFIRENSLCGRKFDRSLSISGLSTTICSLTPKTSSPTPVASKDAPYSGWSNVGREI